LQKIVEDPDDLLPENFPFAAIRLLRIALCDVMAFRISSVGEQGWELHMRYEDGLAVWDALRSTGAIAVGVETHANSRQLKNICLAYLPHEYSGEAFSVEVVSVGYQPLYDLGNLKPRS